MAIAAINREEVLARSCQALGLDPPESGAIDNAFLAALLRHAAGFLCPCSPTTLRSALLESLQYLVDDDRESLLRRVENAIDGLVIGGDLLELHQVTTDDPDAKGTWLFAAPPSFVVRPSGSIFLTGIVADRDTYLPNALMHRIHCDGYTRAIMPESSEDLRGELAALGLQELTQDNWLRTPKAQTAADARSALETKLREQGRSGAIPDLTIIDPSLPVTYYRGRWIKPKRHAGVFVARRPQEYGAQLWCLVELDTGEPTRLLDLPLPKNRWRGCDEAWRFQMATDRCNGTPQLYRVRNADDYAFLDFYSPIPSWAERRLMIFGRHAKPHKCLFSYRIPKSELAAEEEFLARHLWLSSVVPDSVGEH